MQIPTTINTNERIFKILTYDNDFILCNLSTAKELLKNDIIKNFGTCGITILKCTVKTN